MTKTLRLLPFLSLLAVLVVLSGCARYQAVKATETREVGGVFEVQPSRTWSRITQGNREIWTVNGTALQSITFVTGVEDGQSIVKKRPGAQEDPPSYRDGMTALDVVDLFEATLIGSQYSQIETSNLRPVEMEGAEAFMFDFEAYDREGLLKRGFVFAAMQPDTGLSLAAFEAAEEHYYDVFREDARAIFSSIRMI